jgi:hypothetical protein
MSLMSTFSKVATDYLAEMESLYLKLSKNKTCNIKSTESFSIKILNIYTVNTFYSKTEGLRKQNVKIMFIK